MVCSDLIHHPIITYSWYTIHTIYTISIPTFMDWVYDCFFRAVEETSQLIQRLQPYTVKLLGQRL